MMRVDFRVFLVLFGSLAWGTARADVVYDVTLTSTQGNGQQADTISLNQAPPSTGTVIYQIANPPIYSGQTPGYDITAYGLYGFDVANGYTGPTLTFTNGSPSLFFYGQEDFPSADTYSLEILNGTYQYSSVMFPGGDLHNIPVYFSDAGTVTLAPATSAVTPEPDGIALLGTGLVGLAFVLRRRLPRVATTP